MPAIEELIGTYRYRKTAYIGLYRENRQKKWCAQENPVRTISYNLNASSVCDVTIG